MVLCRVKFTFLGAIEKLRKTTITFMCVRLSVLMEQLGYHWMDFDETRHLSFLRKSVEKIQISFQSDRTTGTLHE